MTKPSTPRVATAERRDQIAAATLRVLARTSIDSVTTRQVARELGLTQPALFRHFRSRDALLVAAVDHARGELEAIAVRIVGGAGPAAAQLRAFGQALLETAEREPGLPRLLLSSATPAARVVRDALRHVVSMQTSLVAELVRQGQREEHVDRALDPQVAATLFIGMIQGLVLQWELASRREPLADRFGPLFELWLGGVAPRVDRAGSAAAAGASSGSEEERVTHDDVRRHGSLATLDVRPLIARGVDPLTTILAALEKLPRAGVLVVEAPFRPAPLLALLTRRGHGVTAEELDTHAWVVEVLIGGAPTIEDLRDLEPPEPLERVLSASAALAPGRVYLARLPRVPRMLLPHLRKRALRFDVVERSDGAALLRVERPQ